MIGSPGFSSADVNSAAVLGSLHTDEPIVVSFTHVRELVLVPRIPEKVLKLSILLLI